MAGQTAEDIRDNIVKITDENGKCVGTGFFIDKEYCVTCHHNIWRLDEIFVERELYDIETGQPKTIRRFHAEWVEEFSDMQKDVAFLKVQDADFKPLQYGRETYGKMPVVVRGFPLEDLYHFPDGKDDRGELSDIPTRFPWKVEKAEGKRKKWNEKPEISVVVYVFNPSFGGKFDLGFSGAPVCYQHDWKVVGMFEAKDATKGYVIPMYFIVQKFDLGKGTEKISAPLPTLSTEEILKTGNNFFSQHDYEKAVEQYDIILEDRNYVYALNNKGISLHKLRRYEEAIEYFDRALAIGPNDVYALYNKGISLHKLRRYEEAIEYYNRLLVIESNSVYALSAKGTVLRRLRRYEEAIEYYNRLLAIGPNDAKAWYSRAIANVKLGKVENGLDDLEKAIEINRKYYVELAKKDKDFDSIRNDDRFRALIMK